MPGHIFLSHTTADHHLIDPMIDAMQKAGLDIWADHLKGVPDRGLHPGGNWSKDIDAALNDCDAFVFALSPQSALSDYCTAEWQKALMLKKPFYVARIAPITIPATPTRLVIEQHANLVDDFNAGLAELIHALQSRRPFDSTSPAILPPRKIGGHPLPRHHLDLPLIGRADDMSAVQKLLQGSNRVAVILGMGGVGKTRLALEIAVSANPDQFPAGVIWHEISDMMSPDRLTEQIRDHLGLPITSEETAVWHEAERRPLLIILDNAEACKQPAAYARLLNTLDTASGSRVLMTSRLDWSELNRRQRHDLRQPDLAAAVEILGKMIAQYQPRFSLNGRENELAEAAKRHPRLIEYAVRWADKFPADKVLETLRELKGRSAEEALDEMVNRSVRQVESLPHGPQAIANLRRLAVCRGGFTFAAAEALMTDTTDLDVLISWNLVGVSNERYEIDPLVIAAVGKDDTAHHPHYDFYKALAWAHEKREDYLGLDIESLNLEAAFEWALRVDDGEAAYWLVNACGHFLSNRGRFIQRMDWILHVHTALNGKVNEKLWANVQISLGLIYKEHPLGNRATNLQRAIDAYTDALLFCTPPEAAPLAYAMTQNNLGGAYAGLARLQDHTANLQRAIDAFTESLRFYTPQAAPLEYAAIQNNLGATYRNLAQLQDHTANLQRAIDAFTESLRFRTPQAAPLAYATTQYNLGLAYVDLAQLQDHPLNLQRAIDAYTDALRFRTPQAAPYQYVTTQGNRGIVYEDLGDLLSAINCWREAARVAAQVGNEESATKYTQWADDAEAQLSST